MPSCSTWPRCRVPRRARWDAPYDLLVTGVGGTGVVTVGAVIAMAAHLEGKSASVLDFMGFAQKGGSVLSFVRLADMPARLNQVRIDTQQADAILACDIVVGASPDALQTVRHGRTRILANTHEIPVAESLRNPGCRPARSSCCWRRCASPPATSRSRPSMRRRWPRNSSATRWRRTSSRLGYAWQRGLVPLSLEALMRAIELNGVAVADQPDWPSRWAGWPRATPQAIDALRSADARQRRRTRSLEALVARGVAHLTGYQNAAWAQRFETRVRSVQQREAALAGGDPRLPFTRNAARSLLKLMSYKDEYEVARLYTDGSFRDKLAEQFEGDVKLEFHMAPPLLARPKNGQPPGKIRLGALDAAGDEVAGARQARCAARRSTCSATPRSGAWSAR